MKNSSTKKRLLLAIIPAMTPVTLMMETAKLLSIINPFFDNTPKKASIQ